MSAKKRSEPKVRPSDVKHMGRALQAARKGLGHTSPNPAVGAVVVKNSRVLAVGYHARAGEAHAEVAALSQVGEAARGATLYSTLEPCNHQGRTGPCTKAILRAGIARVVIGTLDPNPLVAGGGVRRLRRGGIEVVTGVLQDACRELNEAYNYAIVERQPYVVLKTATSLDGRIATRTGDSQWITGPKARARGRALRAHLDAIVVGVQTVLADDPQLTARIPGARDPLRVVMDSQLRTPLGSTLVKTAGQTPTLVLTTRAAPASARTALEAAGVQVVALRKTRAGQVDPAAALKLLHARGVNSVLLEGGATLVGSFADAGLIRKVFAFVAPVLIGGRDAPGAVGGRGPKALSQALRLHSTQVEQVGDDLLMIGYTQP